jgi:hypothetical protein
VVGELLGWQGGATLVALVALVAALATFERWAENWRRSHALAVGLGFAVVMAAEPFMALAGAGLLGLRWLVELWREPLARRGWAPTAVPGMVLAAMPVLLTGLALAGRYLAISAPGGSGLRAPDFTSTLNLVAWTTRETPALSVLLVLLLAMALAVPSGTRVVSGGVIALFLLMPAVLSGDASYQERVAYLLPIPLALGGGFAWDRFDASVGWQVPPWVRSVDLRSWTAPLVTAVLLATLAFPTRLAAASAYYSTLYPSDVSLLRSLTGVPGTIVTSWQGNHYWYGLVNSWYVEGLSNRPAIGPTDPALSTRAAERADSAAAWQLFSGEQGMENGALQVAFGPAGWRADPAIAARLFGYYIPLVFISDASNDYGPAMVPAAPAGPLQWSVVGGDASGEKLAGQRPVLRTTASLTGGTVRVDWFRPSGGPDAAWTIWLWPAYGLPWRSVTGGGKSIAVAPDGTEASRDVQAWDRLDPRVRVSVGGGARLQYVPRDPRYGLQAIRITVPAGSDLNLDVSVTGTSAAGTTQDYSERSVIAGEGITAAVVWRNTGWLDRFTTSGCYAPGAANDRVATFTVTPACRS